MIVEGIAHVKCDAIVFNGTDGDHTRVASCREICMIGGKSNQDAIDAALRCGWTQKGGGIMLCPRCTKHRQRQEGRTKNLDFPLTG